MAIRVFNLIEVRRILPPTYHGLDRFLDAHNVENFHAHEISTRVAPPKELWPNILPTLRFAELLRKVFGPITVTSGYRAPVHNDEVGGAPNSLHLSFNALDVKAARGRPHQWAAELRGLGLAELGGIGTYGSFVHIDTRYLMFGREPWVG